MIHMPPAASNSSSKRGVCFVFRMCEDIEDVYYIRFAKDWLEMIEIVMMILV